MDIEQHPSMIRSSIIREIYDYASTIVFSLTIVLLFFSLVFRQAVVQGVSMENTFNAGVISESTGLDRVLISGYIHPQRGDIVVIYAPELHDTIIKRVIGVGGDTVNIDFNRHTVSVNGRALHESYIKEPTARQGDVSFPVTVPEGHLFVMGDNRNDSLDSRFQAVGMVSIKNVFGTVFLRIFPFNTFKWFRNPF